MLPESKLAIALLVGLVLIAHQHSRCRVKANPQDSLFWPVSVSASASDASDAARAARGHRGLLDAEDPGVAVISSGAIYGDMADVPSPAEIAAAAASKPAATGTGFVLGEPFTFANVFFLAGHCGFPEDWYTRFAEAGVETLPFVTKVFCATNEFEAYTREWTIAALEEVERLAGETRGRDIGSNSGHYRRGGHGD